MRKKELQKKSENRLKAVKGSYRDSLYDEVVSDCGLVIELALKATVCKAINEDVYPEFIRTYRTHDPEELINLAKLRSKLEAEKSNDLDFFVNWSLLSKWSINFRYMPPGTYSKSKAENYITAIEGPKGGVYPWIKKNW